MDEPHKTLDGYCCACDYDIAGFERELQSKRTALLKQIKGIVEGMKRVDGRGVKSCECTEYEKCGCKVEDFNLALQSVLESLLKVETEKALNDFYNDRIAEGFTQPSSLAQK